MTCFSSQILKFKLFQLVLLKKTQDAKSQESLNQQELMAELNI